VDVMIHVKHRNITWWHNYPSLIKDGFLVRNKVFEPSRILRRVYKNYIHGTVSANTGESEPPGKHFI